MTEKPIVKPSYLQDNRQTFQTGGYYGYVFAGEASPPDPNAWKRHIQPNFCGQYTFDGNPYKSPVSNPGNK